VAYLQVAVIGCGHVAWHRHLPEFASNPRVRLSAVCDADEANRLAASNKFGARAYADWQELLADPDVQAVSVCLPNHLHAAVTIAALRAGKHVLCEKPMATSLAHADEMIAASQAANRMLTVALQQRFMTVHARAKQKLHSGRLGAALTFATSYAHAGPTLAAGDSAPWQLSRERAGFGAIGDLGVHKVDLIRWLLEDEVEAVAAFVTALERGGSVDDNAVCALQMRSGAVGTLVASWTHRPGANNNTHIFCEHGVLRIAPESEYPLVARYEDGEEERYPASALSLHDTGRSGVIDEFVDAIFSEREPSVTANDGRIALAVILAAVESAHTRCTVEVRS